jgi:hypothetical protein
VRDDILSPANQVDGAKETLFPNYQIKIFRIDSAPTQLILVAVSNELEIDPGNKYPRSLPFLINVHPSPQDTPADHRTRFPALYQGVPDNEIPVFFKDLSGFALSWDFLFFQFLSNVGAGTALPYQLKKADTPFVLVIPMVKSFQTGIGILNSATMLEKCLLGIELAIFNDRIHVPDGVLPEVEWVSFAAFSIGNEILNRFVLSNASNAFAQSKVREYILFDPPPNNPKNRSTIVQNLVPLFQKLGRHIMLYGEDPWYFDPLLRVIAQKRISFNLTADKIFNDGALPFVFLAFLRDGDFSADASAVAKDVHNIFPRLFMKDAAKRTVDTGGRFTTGLGFAPIGTQKFPDYPPP